MASYLRLGGIASGLDTESLITQLMALERRPVQLAEQRKSEIEAERGVWKDIKTRLDNLLSRVQDLQAGEAGFNSGKATSSDEEVLTATAEVGAAPGKYTVTVDQLAAAHSMKSQLLNSEGALGISGTFTLRMKASPGATETLEATVTLDGTENLGQIQSKINDATTAEGKELPLTATIVQVNDTQSHLILTADFTGADSAVTLTEVSGTPLTDLAFTDTQAAQDALLTVNNITGITRSTNSVSDVIPGVTLELLKGAGASATVTVNRDVEKAVATVQGFVDQYNSLAEFIAERSRFDEESGTGGPLLGDSTASRILLTLRGKALDPVYSLPEEYRSADQMGLAGVSFSGDNGDSLNKLSLDKADLRAKLEENPKAVADFFAAMAERLQETIEGYTSSTGILPAKDKAFESQIDRVKDRIEFLERRLELRETNLRRQFEGLETAMQQLQSQQAALMAQLSGLGG